MGHSEKGAYCYQCNQVVKKKNSDFPFYRNMLAELLTRGRRLEFTKEKLTKKKLETHNTNEKKNSTSLSIIIVIDIVISVIIIIVVLMWLLL